MKPILLILTTLFLLSCTQKQERPNILFILTDDQRDNSFSAMGHDWIKTPQVDKLLSKATRFKNTYIAEPTCNPSRAALFLGCHERVNRIGFSSTHGLKDSQWAHSYPALIKDAGYTTAFVGKWHATMDEYNFDRFFDYCEGHKGHGPFFFEVADENGNVKNITTNRNHTNNALKFLDEVSTDAPFCLSICYATPHGSKIRKMHMPMDEPASNNPLLKGHHIYGGMYHNLDIDYPLKNPDNPYDYIPKKVMDQDKGRNKTYVYDYDSASNKEHHYRYHQMITEIDEMVGEIVEKLKSKKIENETIIIFGSDHGLLMGEYGMGGKGLLFDLTCKIPCFIYDPNTDENAQGQTRTELVSSLDITTTILDYAGVEKTEFMDGASLKPLVLKSEKLASWRDGLFLENLYTGRDTPLQEGYVEEDWKYIRYAKCTHPYSEEELLHSGENPVFEMLFNLKEDPEEKNNLITSPETAEIANRLRDKCDKEVEKLNARREKYKEQYLSN